MYKRAAFIFSITLLTPLVTQATCSEFPRTLREGSRGADVVALQKVLNQDTETRVARRGPGSPGNEVSSFGPATTAALKRFQLRYRNVTLTVAGLKNPDGIAGAATRKKLTELSCSLPKIPSQAKPAESRIDSGITLDTPVSYQVRIGDKVTLTGKSLKGATITLGDTTTSVQDSTETSITFSIPESATLGTVTIVAKREKNSSNSIELFIGRKEKDTAGATSACIDITRTLKEGAVGGDVIVLQKFLNGDNRTRVSSEGAGSTGKETTVFTPATTNAVARFQTLYARDILTPAKLDSPTGIVSLFTADKIREITCGSKKLTNEQKEAAAENVKNVSAGNAAALADVAARREKMDNLMNTILSDANARFDKRDNEMNKPMLYYASAELFSSGVIAGTMNITGRNLGTKGNQVHICGTPVLENVESDGYSINYPIIKAPQSGCTLKVVTPSGETNSVKLSIQQRTDMDKLESSTNKLLTDPQLLQNLVNSGDYTALMKALGY